jgi:hypothetical protein
MWGSSQNRGSPEEKGAGFSCKAINRVIISFIRINGKAGSRFRFSGSLYERGNCHLGSRTDLLQETRP